MTSPREGDLSLDKIVKPHWHDVTGWARAKEENKVLETAGMKESNQRVERFRLRLLDMA
jgi:hypothetical protein